jgi:hypothetical protein
MRLGWAVAVYNDLILQVFDLVGFRSLQGFSSGMRFGVGVSGFTRKEVSAVMWCA